MILEIARFDERIFVIGVRISFFERGGVAFRTIAFTKLKLEHFLSLNDLFFLVGNLLKEIDNAFRFYLESEILKSLVSKK